MGPIGFKEPEQPAPVPEPRFTRSGQAEFLAEEALPTIILKAIQRLPQYRLIRYADKIGRIVVAENVTEYVVFKLVLAAVPPAQYITNVVKQEIGLKVKDPVDTTLALDARGPVKFIESIGQATNDIALETVNDVADVEQFLRNQFIMRNPNRDGSAPTGRQILNELAQRAHDNGIAIEEKFGDLVEVFGIDVPGRVPLTAIVPDLGKFPVALAKKDEDTTSGNLLAALVILSSTRAKESRINQSPPLYTSDP